MGGEKDPEMGTSLKGEAEREEAGDSLDMLKEKADISEGKLRRKSQLLYWLEGAFDDKS